MAFRKEKSHFNLYELKDSGANKMVKEFATEG